MKVNAPLAASVDPIFTLKEEDIVIAQKIFMAVLVLCCLARIASADDSGLTKEFAARMDASGGVTVEMIECIGAETKRQDERLNKAYKEVMAQLSETRQKQLQDAQRAWIKFRDAHCHFHADPDGGTMATVRTNDCFLSATASRAQELEGFKE